MTQTEIENIELELGVKLPRIYVEIMAGPQAAEAKGEFWHKFLFNTPKRVIDDTRWLHDVILSFGGKWQPTYVVVSEINGGDMVILDTSSESSPLLVWDHETNLMETSGPLTQFAQAPSGD